MTRLETRHASRRIAMPMAALLALALLWAQLLGLAHGVRHAHASVPPPVYFHVHVHAHAHAEEGASAHVHVTVSSATPGEEGAAAGLWAHLLAPEGDAHDCRLYDQLGHGGPVLQLPPALLHVLACAPLDAVPSSLPPQSFAAYAARAPPAFL